MKKELLKNWEILFKATRNMRQDGHFIYEAFKDLTPREQKILSMRFGLEDGITHTLEEAGKEFGVTRERIRQIEEKALEEISIFWKVLRWTKWNGKYKEISRASIKSLKGKYPELFKEFLDEELEKVLRMTLSELSPSKSAFWEKTEKEFNKEFDKKFPTRLINTYKINSTIYCSDCNAKLSPIYGWDKLKSFIREEGFIPFWKNGLKEGYSYGFQRGFELGRQKGQYEEL